MAHAHPVLPPCLLALAAVLAPTGCEHGEYGEFGEAGDRVDHLSPGVGGGGDDDTGSDDDTSGSELEIAAGASLDAMTAELVDSQTYVSAQVTVTLTVANLDGVLTVDDTLDLDLFDLDDTAVSLNLPVAVDAPFTVSQDGTHSATYRTDPSLTSSEWFAWCDHAFYGQIAVFWGEAVGQQVVTGPVTLECTWGGT